MLPIRAPFFHVCSGTLCALFSFNAQGNLLTDALKPLQCPTNKPLSDTRWEARYDALHALRKGYQAVLQVLKAMCGDNDEKYQTKETARGFVSLMEKLETGILLEVWSCIMERFHKTSQALQDSKMTLSRVTNLLQGLHDFIKLLRSQLRNSKEEVKWLSSLR